MTLISHQDEVLELASKGNSFSLPGGVVTFKAVTEDTNGAYTLIEVVTQPDDGVPPHSHSLENEAFYVVEGKLEFQLDDQTIVAGAGAYLYSPANHFHGFRNISSTPAKFLMLYTPSGVEKFFAEGGTRVENSEVIPSPITEADIEKVTVAASKYGVTT